MLIPTQGLKVNNKNFGKYITQAQFGFHKLWGKGSGRNLAGATVGTFNIYPKVTMSFRKLTRSEVETVVPIMDAQSQSLVYYDPDLHRQNTISTYTNDVEYTQNKINNVKMSSVAFISRNRRV